MTSEELCEIAKSGAPMPKSLSVAEIWYFQAVKYIIFNFTHGAITSEAAKNAKSDLDNEFFKRKQTELIYNQHAKIQIQLSNISKKMVTGECKTCRLFIRLFDGFISPERVEKILGEVEEQE